MGSMYPSGSSTGEQSHVCGHHKYLTTFSKEVMSNKYFDFHGDLHLGFLIFPGKPAGVEADSKPGRHYSGFKSLNQEFKCCGDQQACLYLVTDMEIRDH